MQLYERLGVPCGVTAVIGSGGKTTLLRTLSRELPGTVILTTTTHILPFEGVPLLTAPTEDEVRAALTRSRVLCLGTPAPEGKLTAPSLPFSLLEQLADYVLVEADGSRRLPLKAHAPHEPVIPKEAGCVLCVVGARGFDRPIREAVHHPEQFCTLTGARLDEPASPALAARALAAEGFTQTIVLTGAAEKQRSAFSAAAQQYGLRVISI